MNDAASFPKKEGESILSPLDRAFVLYLLASGFLAATFLHPDPLGAALGTAHALAAMIVPFAVRALGRRESGWRRVLRAWYVSLFFLPLYMETSLINQASPVPRLDPWLMRLDDIFFGASLSEILPAALPMPWFREVMAASYFGYYLFIPGAGLYLWIRKKERFRPFLFTVALCFFFCYLLFIILPSGGPQQSLQNGEIHWEGFFFGPLLTGMLGLLEVDSGAFPSSHVAVALIVVVFLWREKSLVRYAASLFFLGLFLSTVYGGPHYGIDLPAGLLTGAVFLRITRPRLLTGPKKSAS